MALFTDTRELDRQEKTFNKNPSTGNKAVLTSMLGYKSDGTLNTWGKINPFIGGGGTNKLAAEINKGNDAGKALAASQAEANQHTKDKLKLGLDVLTLGGSKLATSITQGISGIEGGDATDIAGKIKDFATGSYFSPYITTVGLYDNDKNLLAIGKLPVPTKIPMSADLEIQVAFDAQ